MKCPCEKCPDKGCGVFHDDCEAYQEFYKWRIEKCAGKMADNDYKNYKNDVITKERRRMP